MDNSGDALALCHSEPMRSTAATRGPVLNPAVRLLWRAERTVQLELGSAAVVVDGISPPVVRRLLSSTGAAPPATDPATDPVTDPVTDPASRHALRTLADTGFLWAPPADCDEDDRLVPPQARLAAELNALNTCHGERGAELLNARRHVTVAVHGQGRAGALLAALLAAAGVGRVHLRADSAAGLQHTVPGGVTPSDEGVPLSEAAERAVRRAAPETDTSAVSGDERPDLVVLACDEPIERERRDALHAADCAHLVVRLGPEHGVVGPLVIPGLTSCLSCADLHRLDRDPAWNALAVQLSLPRRRPGGSDVTVATIIAGVAAMQVLAYLDGGEPAVVDGTLEMHLPDWRIRRRSWPIHPDCDCVQPG